MKTHVPGGSCPLECAVRSVPVKERVARRKVGKEEDTCGGP